METKSLYWAIRTPIEEARTKLMSYEKADLVHLCINEEYNKFVGRLADYGDDKPVDAAVANGKLSGKRVPYVGWYWRDTDFSRKKIRIGDCGDFIGIMENNKWDHPERYLTEEEADSVISIIDRAMEWNRKGGDLGVNVKSMIQELEKLWPYLQTLTIQAAGND